MTERLQKIIASRGIASRRKAEDMIAAGRVTCNGRVCLLGESANPDKDEIRVDGKLLPSASTHLYIMLHKPRGFVTTLSDEKGRKARQSVSEPEAVVLHIKCETEEKRKADSHNNSVKKSRCKVDLVVSASVKK